MQIIKEIAYKAIDIATLGRGIKRTYTNNSLRIPTRYFRYFNDAYEAENIEIINQVLKPGMFVIDVGAHIGLLSVIMGKKVRPGGKIFSFEPAPSTFNLLEKTIRLNKMEETVIPVKAALSNKTGETIFYISDKEADNSNSLADNKRTDRNEGTINVKLYSTDDFVMKENINRLDLIKIDAEGAELKVLKGSIKTIERYHPVIILALHPKSIINFGDSLDEIWSLLIQLNYSVLLHSKEMTREDFITQTDLFDVILFQKK